MDESKWRKRLRGSSVTVVGLGVSNLPLIDFLLENGVKLSARDRKSRDALGDLPERLEARGVKLILGEEYLDGIVEDVIFRSPGLRPDLPAFLQAVRNGALLTSEMELFLELTPATVIGVTGSDGKTTTTTLTGLMLKEECKRTGQGNVFVGGNIGTPLLPSLKKMREQDFAVVELSSFQLQTLGRSPHRAAITNLSPNHLDWHIDMEEYAAAKTNVYRHAPNSLLVANAENAITCRLAKQTDRPITWFSSSRASLSDFEELLRENDRAVYLSNGTVRLWDGETEHTVLKAEDILLPGKHNLENYMTAIALTQGLVSKESIETVAKSFGGVPHRLERIRVLHGVTYYNSSIDSSPSRTAAALSALSEKPIVICGGYDKNIPFEPLAKALCDRAKAVILTGATAQKIRAAIDDCPEKSPPIYFEPDFTGAVHFARQIATAGDTVLLSPACASFDAFKNFEERGNTFRRIVETFEE